MLRSGLMLQSPAFLLLLGANLVLFAYHQLDPTQPHHLDPSSLLEHVGLPRPASLSLHRQSSSSADLDEADSPADPVLRKNNKQARPFSSGRHQNALGLGASTERHAAIALKQQQATQTCEVCVANSDDPLCEYGLDNIRLSRAYQGSGHRVRKMLEKALRGEKIRIGVIGGSVSTGHGLQPGQDTWHSHWFKAFQKEFPNSELFNGALPASGSNFFGWCFPALVPEDLDIYLLEVDVNNEGDAKNEPDDDALHRAILNLPQEPALIRLTVVATSFPDLSRGFTSNLAMSSYFDTPIISVRNFLLPHFIAHPGAGKDFFGYFPDGNLDYRHMATLGHSALGDMLTLYIKEQICETRRRQAHPIALPASRWPQADILGMVPRLYLWEPYSASKVAAPVHPSCAFTGSERSPLTPLAGHTSPSWTRVDWNGKAAYHSNEVGSRVSFAFNGNKIGMFVYQSSGAGHAVKPGRMACWIDEPVEGQQTLVDAWWPHSIAQPLFHLVKENLETGPHILHCEILADSSTDGHEIRIVGVASQ